MPPSDLLLNEVRANDGSLEWPFHLELPGGGTAWISAAKVELLPLEGDSRGGAGSADVSMESDASGEAAGYANQLRVLATMGFGAGKEAQPLPVPKVAHVDGV
jgi:hypothetical protein